MKHIGEMNFIGEHVWVCCIEIKFQTSPATFYLQLKMICHLLDQLIHIHQLFIQLKIFFVEQCHLKNVFHLCIHSLVLAADNVSVIMNALFVIHHSRVV